MLYDIDIDAFIEYLIYISVEEVKEFLEDEARDKLQEWADADGDEWEDLIAEHKSSFNDNYIGEYKNAGDFAFELFDKSGDLVGIPDVLLNNINWDEVGQDLLSYDYYENNGYYFYA